MLNKKIIELIFVIGYIFSLQALYCQLDTTNNSYFTNLKKSLTKDGNVKEVKLVQEKILKGQGFIQSMYVKFKDDPKGRFYNVGKEFIYNTSNNSLGYVSNTNVETQIVTDTTFSYTDNGEIGLLEIYSLPYDSIITIKRGNNIWSGIMGN